MSADRIVRRAEERDAEQLAALNVEFNGAGGPGPDMIRESLCRNTQEEVFVSEENGELTGFLCVQLKRSFCYTDLTPEITELYVLPGSRRKGTATELLDFAERCCSDRYSLHKIELLTGDDNLEAGAVYEKAGFQNDGEVHLVKRLRR